MILRFLASIVLLLSVLFMPIWLSAVLGLGAVIYFHDFYEALVLFLLSDLLYGAKGAGPFGAYFATFIISVILFILIQVLKRKLNINKEYQ